MQNTAADTPLINPVSIEEEYIHVVAAIIWRDSARRQFLISRRQKGKHLQDYWELPGGKMEPGESPRQALSRELLEEINIRPEQESAFMQVYYRYPERNVLLDTWMVGSYLGVVEPREQQALTWIEVDQADSYLFPPADVPILRALQELQGTA